MEREPSTAPGHISTPPGCTGEPLAPQAILTGSTSSPPAAKAAPCQNITRSWRMGAPDPGKDLAVGEVKPNISTLEAPSCCTPKPLLGKQHLLLRQTRVQLTSQSISALFPYQTSPGSWGECTNRSSLQNMTNTDTKHEKCWHPKKPQN